MLTNIIIDMMKENFLELKFEPKKGTLNGIGMLYPWWSLFCPFLHVLHNITDYQMCLQNILLGPLENSSETAPSSQTQSIARRYLLLQSMKGNNIQAKRECSTFYTVKLKLGHDDF